jgi:hypothetical protein
LSPTGPPTIQKSQSLLGLPYILRFGVAKHAKGRNEPAFLYNICDHYRDAQDQAFSLNSIDPSRLTVSFVNENSLFMKSSSYGKFGNPVTTGA